MYSIGLDVSKASISIHVPLNSLDLEIENNLKEKTSTDYEAFLKVKEEIFNLMEKADVLAERLRKNILD